MENSDLRFLDKNRSFWYFRRSFAGFRRVDGNMCRPARQHAVACTLKGYVLKLHKGGALYGYKGYFIQPENGKRAFTG